jgi:hypothetical protein
MYGYVVTIIVALLASLPGLLALRKNRHKDQGDAVKTYKDLVDEQATQWAMQHSENVKLQAEIDELKLEAKCWRDLFRRWQAGIRVLIDQVTALGKEPAWEPSHNDLDCIEKKKGKKE